MSEITIKFDGRTYDLDDFELGDLEWLEEYLGGPLNDAALLNSMKAAVGFVYLIKKTQDPTFTLDDARKTKLAMLEDAEEEPAAKPAAKRRPPKRAAR